MFNKAYKITTRRQITIEIAIKLLKEGFFTKAKVNTFFEKWSLNWEGRKYYISPIPITAYLRFKLSLYEN